ncbi:MAG TPA: DUF1127 domain-containing protein [Acetobacteraceae bacterium]|nr:DUF1127 domain-containing protein [Acetobacteraceae bacterium]
MSTRHHHDATRAATSPSADGLMGRVRLWRRRSRERAMLASLDDRLLRDIGLTRCDIAGETSKFFWRA